MDCFAEIREMISKVLALDEKVIVADANLQDDLGADSLALLDLAEAISYRYGFEIEPDDLVDLKDVGELARVVESRSTPLERA